MIPEDLVERLLAADRIDAGEAQRLRRAAVRDADELRALLDDVPLWSAHGLRVARLRDAVEDLVHPDSGPTPSPYPGREVPLPDAVPRRAPRGTCVAHAVAACIHRAAPAAPPSAAWIHDRAKANPGEPWPDRVETSLRDALEALARDGSAPEHAWSWEAGPDHPTPTPTELTGGWRVHHHVVAPGEDVVRDLLELLAHGLPVALTFRTLARTDDRLPDGRPLHSNLTGRGPSKLGRLFTPPPGAPRASAHCVCVHAFIPDGREPGGGWFVARSAPGAIGVGRRRGTHHGRLEIGASYLADHTLDWGVAALGSRSGFPSTDRTV